MMPGENRIKYAWPSTCFLSWVLYCYVDAAQLATTEGGELEDLQKSNPRGVVRVKAHPAGDA